MRSGEWQRTRSLWAQLRQLHVRPIELERLERLRASTKQQLTNQPELEALIASLGLNDECIDEFPASLKAYCGTGLLIWQYPNQFGAYLRTLAGLDIRSYLEVGIRHGGSFVTTVEYLQRFRPIERAIAVDVIPCPAMTAYRGQNPAAEFWCVSTRSDEFARRLDGVGEVDLVFIDSHHEEEQCREELRGLAERARMIALHDVANIRCEGIRKVWDDIKRSKRYRCDEFVEQYGDAGPFMGIGLAVRS